MTLPENASSSGNFAESGFPNSVRKPNRAFDRPRRAALAARRQEMATLTDHYTGITERFPFIWAHTAALVYVASETNLVRAQLDPLLALSLWTERPEAKGMIMDILGIYDKTLGTYLDGVIDSRNAFNDRYLAVHRIYRKSETSVNASSNHKISSKRTINKLGEYPKIITPLDVSPVFRHPFWFGAGMEVAAYIGYNFKEQYRIATPIIELVDNNKQRMEALGVLCGVTIRPQRGTYFLGVSGKKATDLADLISGYSPSRKAIITSFQEWKGADSKEERYDIAKSFNPQDMDAEIDPAVYSWLVAQPEFLAGVFDWRGDEMGGSDRDTYKIGVPSQNSLMLEVLARTYGGRFTPIENERKKTKYGREDFGIKHIAIWNIPTGLYQDLLRMVEPHMLIRDLRMMDKI